MTRKGTSVSVTTASLAHLPLSTYAEGGFVQERYRIDRLLARGGYGFVYLAYDLRLHRQVCMKISTGPSLYYNEATLLEILTHPSIPKLFDRFTDPPNFGLVMEYIDGWTLREYLDTLQGCPLPIPVALRISQKLMNILEFLHQRRYPIIFRDLKPDNVLITKDGKIYLVDFGIACLDPRPLPEGRERVLPGTVGYMSPEYYRDGYISPGLDLFALGAIMHEMLTGEPPLHCVSQSHGTECHCNIFKYRDLHGPLGEFVMSLLSLDVTIRPANVTQVKEDLQSLWKEQSRRKRGLIRHSIGVLFTDPTLLVW